MFPPLGVEGQTGQKTPLPALSLPCTLNALNVQCGEPRRSGLGERPLQADGPVQVKEGRRRLALKGTPEPSQGHDQFPAHGDRGTSAAELPLVVLPVPLAIATNTPNQLKGGRGPARQFAGN